MRISTPASPTEVTEIDLRSGKSRQLKISVPPNGHDSGNYVVRRNYGVSGDGQLVPLTIVHHKDVVPNHESPVLLTGYGAYGMSLTPGFSATRRILLTRGVIHVTAHVRGGMEKGYQWYRSGRMANKDKSFDDFVGAAESLIRDGYTSAGRIIIHGGSAGGLLVGAAAMRRPELFGRNCRRPICRCAQNHARRRSTTDTSGMARVGESDRIKDAKRRLSHFSPTQMVEKRPYPCILATASFDGSTSNLLGARSLDTPSSSSGSWRTLFVIYQA